MNKSEFIDGLTRALASTGSESLIRENREYYSSYIDEEIKKGRSEEEVLEELGEPRLIANSIKEAAGYEGFTGIDEEPHTFESKKTNMDKEDYYNRENYYNSERTDKKIFSLTPLSLILILVLGIAVIGLIFSAIFSIIGGILSLIAPVLGPILLIIAIMIFIRIFRK